MLGHGEDPVVLSLPVLVASAATGRAHLLLNVARSIAVHEDSGDLQEDFHGRTLSRQFKQLKRSGHIETDRDIETSGEVDIGRAVDDDVEVLGDFRSQLLREVECRVHL